MPYYESTSEEAERVAGEWARTLQVLAQRSAQLRSVRNQLGILAGMIKNSKRKEATALIEKLMTEIST